MTTPLFYDTVGSTQSVTTANSIANNAFCNAADILAINNTGNALLADFRLTGVSFGTAPVGGVVQLFAVDADFANNFTSYTAATIALMNPRLVGNFSPAPIASNAKTAWIMSLNRVPLTENTQFWIYNNGTGYTLASGLILTAQLWSPGT